MIEIFDEFANFGCLRVGAELRHLGGAFSCEHRLHPSHRKRFVTTTNLSRQQL